MLMPPRRLLITTLLVPGDRSQRGRPIVARQESRHPAVAAGPVAPAAGCGRRGHAPEGRDVEAGPASAPGTRERRGADRESSWPSA